MLRVKHKLPSTSSQWAKQLKYGNNVQNRGRWKANGVALSPLWDTVDKVKYYIKLISNIIIFYILNLYFDLLYLKNILYLLHTITHKLSNDNYMYRTFKLEAFEFVIVMYVIYFTVTFNFNTILVEIFNFNLYLITGILKINPLLSMQSYHPLLSPLRSCL